MQRITSVALISGLAFGCPAIGDDDTVSLLHARLLASSDSRDSFQLKGESGASLDITGYFLTRYIASFSDGFGEKDTISGFDQPRIRLGVKGKLNETFGYKIIGDYANGKTALTDGFITAKLGENTSLTAGQFIQPFTRETDVSSSRQTAVERSVANSFFTVDRSQGVMIEWRDEKLRWRGAFNDGAKASNTEFLDQDEADFGITGRIEYLVEGSWSQFKDFQGWKGGGKGLMLGGAVHYQSSEDTGAFGGDPASFTTTDLDDQIGFTADVSVEFTGASAMVAFYSLDRKTGSGDFTDLGFVVQGGVMAGDQTELFARWDSILSDSDRSASDDVHVLTAGMSYFFVPESHAAKLTVDVQHVLSDLNDGPAKTSSKRTLVDSDDPQTALRAQVVVRF